MDNLDTYVDLLRNSREFLLGSRLRQTPVFKFIRHYRLRDKLVAVKALPSSEAGPDGREVCLLGIWSEEYPLGMPLEFAERHPRKWVFKQSEGSPFGASLSTNQTDTLMVYSSHENLRLDFRMDKFAGKVQVATRGRNKVFDLHSPLPGTLSVFPNQGAIESNLILSGAAAEKEAGSGLEWAQAVVSDQVFTVDDLRWLEIVHQNPRPVSINNPSWRGILSASRELFGEVFPLPDDLDDQKGLYYARLFKESQVPSLTIQGFPHTYVHLVKALHRIGCRIPVYVIWHGNFLQMRDNYEWTGLSLVKDLISEGKIARLGFVKQGMAEVMQAAGIPASFVMNYVRKIPEGPSAPDEPANQIGIWGEPDWGWRKPVYGMLAALSLIPNAHAQVAFVSPRALEFSEWFHLDAQQYTKPLVFSQVLDILPRMHLNINVTLSECAPMLPLESLSLGSPCLLGPTSHYFQDHEYLHSRLVVPYPEHAEVIAARAVQAIAERDQIVEAYREYAPDYNRRARTALSNFLEFPMDEA